MLSVHSIAVLSLTSSPRDLSSFFLVGPLAHRARRRVLGLRAVVCRSHRATQALPLCPHHGPRGTL